MLGILLDMIVIWFLLNFFSEENWDDQKGRLFFITIVITIFGGVAVFFLTPQIGLLSLALYLIIGAVVLNLLGGLNWTKAFQTMGVFLVYKILFTGAIYFLTK